MLAFFPLKYDVSTLKDVVNMLHCIIGIGFSGFSRAQHLFAFLKKLREINGTDRALNLVHLRPPVIGFLFLGGVHCLLLLPLTHYSLTSLTSKTVSDTQWIFNN